MSGTAILSEIIATMTSGIVGVAEGAGAGLSTLATAIFLTGEGETQTISVFGTLTVVFAGIALGIGLMRYVVNWLTSFGN